MNLMKQFTEKERDLLNNAGVNIEDREYSNEEIKRCERNLEEFIWSHSIKNGDIDRLNNQYSDILKVLTAI